MTQVVGMRPLVAPRPETDAAPAGVREQRLRTVAKEFEALFVNQLLSAMRETVAMSDLIDNDGEIQHYRQLYDQALADRTAGSGGFGIADLIVRDYLPRVQAADAAGAPAAGPVPAATPQPARPSSVELSGNAVAEPGARARREALAAYRKAALAEAEAPRPSAGSPAPDGWRERAASLGGAVADTLSRFGGQIERASLETGIEPELILAVMVRESGGRADALSGKGARGLMQLMPATAREVGVEDIDDPAQNIRGGARYLARLRERFGERLDLVLAGYNAGPGAVSRAGDRVPSYPETEQYVEKVTGLYARLRS